MSVRPHIADVVLVCTSLNGTDQGLGLVRYIGPVRNSSAEYIGVELLEPIEHGHDGMIGSDKYFECRPNHGIHVLRDNVIAKLSAADIFIKFQEAVSMLRSQIFSYGDALNQRDSHISDLIETQKKFKAMISANIRPTNTQTSTYQPMDEMNTIMIDNMASNHQPISDHGTVIIKDAVLYILYSAESVHQHHIHSSTNN